MKERRNSDRIALSNITVKELNGDYLFQLKAMNLSEEGIFLRNKFCSSEHDAFSKLSFTLPDGHITQSIVARIVREHKSGAQMGCAYEFLKISEIDRMALKKFFSLRAPLAETH